MLMIQCHCLDQANRWQAEFDFAAVVPAGFSRLKHISVFLLDLSLLDLIKASFAAESS